MKFIKIFLASSIREFEQERRQLGDFIRSLNDIYVRRGIYFELTICENLDNALAMERKQQEYNQFIKDSQYFYVMFGRKAGAYTIEEFDVALEQFRSSGSPRIFTYFLSLPEGEQPEQSVVDFMERLDKQIGHYYSTFVHMDAIKLNFLLELVRDPQLNSQIKFEDGQAVLDEQPVLSLEHMPLYSKNQTVQNLLKEQERLNGEFARLAMEYGKNPADTRTLAAMMKLGEERVRVSDSLHQLEMDMLGLYSQTAEKRRSGKPLNWREKKAIACVDLGDYEGAKNILRDAQWEKEIEQAQERIDAAKESIREYISGKRALISTLMATGLKEETLEEIDRIYERCCDLAQDHEIEVMILYDYANYLFSQRRYPKAGAVGETLAAYSGKHFRLSQPRQAQLSALLGRIYFWNQEYARSERSFRKAYELYGCLAKEAPEKYENELSMTCCGMAVLLEAVNRLSEAEALFQEAIQIQRRLANSNPRAYEINLAYVCNDYGILLGKINDFRQAEAIHREALEIQRRYQTEEPYTQDTVARSCLNLARVLERNNQLEEAEALGKEALEIRKKLAAKNPEKYQPDLALCCNNLAATLIKANRLEEAEALYREGLRIRRQLAAVNPKAYRTDLALSCSNLAKLLEKKKRTNEAEALYQEALEIRRELARSDDSSAYEEELANSCVDMARFLELVLRFSEAEAFYLEAHEIYRRLVKADPRAFEAPQAALCLFLGYHLKTRKRFEEARPYYEEALEIERRLARENPKVYTVHLEDTILQFGIFLREIGQVQEAEDLLLEAVELCRFMAGENPELYEPHLASAYDNLGILWRDGKEEQAYEMLKASLEIYERLARNYPDIYRSEKARVLFDLARLNKKQGRLERAEEAYEEAWKIYDQLAKVSPDTWCIFLSSTSYNLYQVKVQLGKWEEAERYCREALKADRRLAAQNPSIYWGYPAESGTELAKMLCENQETREEAKELYLEILDIYQAHPGQEWDAERIRKILEEQFG